MLYQAICSHANDLIAIEFDERMDIGTDQDMNCEINDKRASYFSHVPSELNGEKVWKEGSKIIECMDTKKMIGNKFYLCRTSINKRQIT